MKISTGGVTTAKGFSAASCEANIKYKGREDMALLYSEVPCCAAGTYTKNVFKAAPVIWDHAITSGGVKAQAVVINSGIANACTGEEGLSVCAQTADEAAKALGVDAKGVLVASTGVIGMQIPMDRISAGIQILSKNLSSSEEAAHRAARAIMTTDTQQKEAAFTFEIGGKTAGIGGMCKGSGMIHPNMGTMLSFIATDVDIAPELLQKALKDDVDTTYNMVSVDGDTSTNDTVLLLANGMAGNEKITEENEDYRTFCEALHAVNVTLAKKIAGDGEGATALFEVVVKGAATKEKAVTVAKSVVSSSLVKTAVAGHDANWGRILCAMGYSGADFDPEIVSLWLKSESGTIHIAENGNGLDFDEEAATKILSAPEVTALIDMHEGSEEATAWGCDLTHEYISINADYRS